MQIDDSKGLTKRKELLSSRNILWLMTFWGFIANGLLQGNVNLTIIAMVVPRPKAAIVAQCKLEESINSSISNLWTNRTSISSVEHTTLPILSHHANRYAWTEYQQGLVLGGYYWIHWISQFIGGFLTHRYGTKSIFGRANLCEALLGLLTPLCVRYHLYAFVALRVAQGAFSGCTHPAMHTMIAKWVPLNERNKFITSYLGTSVGTALSFPLCAMLVNWFGWESVFYVTSIFGIVWFIAWQYLVYDTPQQHPRITKAERTYILENLGDSVSHSFTKRSVPWKAILTSGPVWITAIATAGDAWGLFTITIEAPSYFNYMHGWNIKAAGALASAPIITRMVFCYAFSSFADWILKKKKMSRTHLRKFALLVSSGIQGIMIFGLAFSGCHPILAIIFMIVGVGASGALIAGPVSTCMDISPNYASVTFGISASLSALLAVVTPMVVGILTNNNQTIEQWRLVFIIATVISIVSVFPFIIFIKAEPQPWNYVENVEQCDRREVRSLRPKSEDHVKDAEEPNTTEVDISK